MTEGAPLLETLALALAAAGIAAIMVARIGLPLMVGYVLAGVAIGPFTPGLVADLSAVNQLADFGIVLLMFAIGAQFTFSDLTRVGRVAVVGALVQILLTLLIAYAVAALLGWEPLESLAFGFVVSNSSSTVLTKVLGEFGEWDSVHGRIGLAWSSLQDLSSILMVVLLMSLGSEPSNSGVGRDVAQAIGLAALFLAILVPVGIYLIPRLLEQLAGYGNPEVFVLAAAGIALAVAFAGAGFGVSPALAAFLAGMFVARSDLAHHVLGEIAPIRDVFAAVFFVAVGMLVDPALLVDQFHLVAVSVAIIVLVKGTISAAITVAFGYRVKTAVLTGVVLAQSAEFSFLMARVGSEAGILSSEVFSVLLLGAVVSILLAPFAYRLALPASVWLDARYQTKRIDPPISYVGEPPAGHALLLGYGRVGRVIADALRAAGHDFVIVEQDRGLVEELRARNELVLIGSASNRVVLERAGLARAALLVVAIPDPIAIRRIMDFARDVNPGLDIVVRTHSVSERDELERRGATEAVVGEVELALEMSRHCLLRYGGSLEEIETVLAQLRDASGFRVD
jgi:monovalent cation:H+ antiporter-2, CPA2 family